MSKHHDNHGQQGQGHTHEDRYAGNKNPNRPTGNGHPNQQQARPGNTPTQHGPFKPTGPQSTHPQSGHQKKHGDTQGSKD